MFFREIFSILSLVSFSSATCEQAEKDKNKQLLEENLCLDCGVSPEFANFRRPKPLSFSDREDELYRSGDPRIINGQLSKKGSWPWQVSLKLKNPIVGDIGHWCGAVLVNQYWVVTAAHCVHNKLVTALGGGIWSVVVGDWDRDSEERDQVEMVVEQVVTHPHFSDYQNDVALLRLPHPLPHLTPVCLPRPTTDHDDTLDSLIGLRCVATGWGQTTHDGGLESRLHQVVLRLVNNTDCDTMYRLRYGVNITHGHVCAGPEVGQVTGTCVGDSGGPLQCNLKDGRWYLLGVTSFGSGCAKPGFPDVFVRISKYSQWINDVIDNWSNRSVPK